MHLPLRLPTRQLMVCFALLLMLLGGRTARAQQVFWDDNTPKFDNSRIVMLEGERTLLIKTAVLGQDVDNPKIVVEMPADVTFVSATSPTAGFAFTQTLTSGSPQVLTLAVTSDGGKLKENEVKEIHIKVKAATCLPPNSTNVNFCVKMLKADGTPLADNLGNTFLNAPANIVKPILTLEPQQAAVNCAAQTDKPTVTYFLKATTADKASSARVSFTTNDAATTLSNFAVNSTPVPAASITTTNTATGKTYTFDVTTTMLGGNEQINNGSTPPRITFKVASTGVGAHRITTHVQFPATSDCNSNPGRPMQVIYPIPTSPHMVHVSTNYATPYPGNTPIDPKDIDMDGSTVTTLKTTFRNNGGPAKGAKFDFGCYGSYNYLDLVGSQVYVQIGSGPRTPVALTNMEQLEKLSSSDYVQERFGVRKSGVVGKPRRIHVTIHEPIPAGETITFWVPTINGNIYNNTTNNVYNNYSTNTVNGFTSNVLSVTATDGKPGTMETMPSHRLVYLNVSHYREIPASLNLRGGKTKTQTVYVAPGSTDEAPVELRVKTPNFLKITDMKLSQDADGSNPINTTPIPGGNNYERGFTVSGKGRLGAAYLHVTYEAEACGSPLPSTNTTGKIHYWANHNWSGGTMEYVSQVFQDATHLCAVEGIRLDTFHLVRTTVGRNDSNNNGIADDNSNAPADKIRNDVYISGDHGYFYWEGTVQSPGGFKVVEMPLELGDGLTFGDIIQMDATGLEGNVNTAFSTTFGGTVTFTPTANRKGGLVKFIPTSPLSATDTVKVKAPFKIVDKKGANKTVGVETEMFVRTDPSSTIRVGQDKASASMGTYTIDSLNWWYHDGLNHTFRDNSVVNFTSNNQHLGFTDIFHNGSFGPPYFKNEARVVRYLDSLEFEMPKGYHLIPNIEVYRAGTPSTDRITVMPDLPSSTKTRRRYAVAAAAYDLDFDETQGVQPSGGKWPAPDDFWKIYSYGKIQAYPSARRGESIMKRTSVWRNPKTGEVSRHTRNITFTYSGPANTLRITPRQLTAQSRRLKRPILTVNKSSGNTPIPNLYFYFSGPIKDVKLKKDNNTYAGEGVDNRWVKVNPSISGTDAYEMEYTYDRFDQAICDKVDTVVVYTGFGDPNWPNTANAIDEDGPNFSAVDTFFITVDKTATLIGAVTAENAPFPAKTQSNPSTPNSYKVYATFEASSTAGPVKNPRVDLHVPAYQVYKAGTARLKHAGQSITIPASLDANLVSAIGSASNITTERSCTINLKDANGGNDVVLSGGSELSDAERRDTIELVFEAECETDFTGVTYTGTFYGTNICGAAATGNGNGSAKLLYPDVIYNYRFGNVAIEMKQMAAFNEFRTRDTLVLKFKKSIGSSHPMSATDHLYLRLPKPMNVEGDSVHYLGAGVMSALNKYVKLMLPLDSTVGKNRYYRIPLPKAEFDNATGRGVGGEITCTIPLVYNRPAAGPDSAFLVAHPIDTVEAAVRIEALFGACPPRPTLDGKSCDSLAMITAKGPFPPRLYVGENESLEIYSRNFIGILYTDSARTTANLATPDPIGPVWEQSPRDTSQLGEVKYYFSPLFSTRTPQADFGGPKNKDANWQGLLPFPVKIWIHPWFIRNLPRFAYICSEVDTLRVKGGGMDIRYQWFRNGQPIAGATDTKLVIREGGRYHVTITDTVPETVSSDTADVYFREIPVITKDLPDRRECDSVYLGLAVAHTGRFMQYQWYRNGLPIPGATDSVYMASAYDSSGFYRVRVMNPCGDSVLSRRCYIDFCDDRWDPFARTVELFTPNTVVTQPAGQMHQVPSRRDFRFTVRAQSGQSLRYATITADHPAWAENGGGIERTMSSDSVMTVLVRRVNQNLRIYVRGISPTANLPVDPSACRVWTHRDRLYIHADRPQSVRLYTVMGHLYREQSLPAGLTIIDRLPSGFYIIRFADGHAEKVRVE